MLSFILPLVLIIFAVFAFAFEIISFFKEKHNGKFSIGSSIFSVAITLLGTLCISVPIPNIYPLNSEAKIYEDQVEITINAINFPFLNTYYSLDGSDPKYGNTYNGSFVVTESTTVSSRNKFLWGWSDLSERTYTVRATTPGPEMTNSKEDIINELKNDGVAFHELWLMFFENDIEVWNNKGEIEILLGNQITNLDSIELKLINNQYQIEFFDYTIEQRNVTNLEKKVVIFKNVPSGYYTLESSINGYEFLITNDLILSADRLQGDIINDEKYWGARIYLTANDSTRLLPYYIDVVDSKGNKINNLKCSLVYKDKRIKIGNYEISNGRIQLNFWTHKGSMIGIVINDNYYEIKFDDVNQPPQIVID